jgi:membrane-associated phospholipid phosphatase
LSATALLAAILFVGFVVLAVLAGPHAGLLGWDARVTEAFVSWRTSGRSHLFWVMTLLGDTPVLAAFGASAVVLLAVWGRRARATVIAVGLLGGWGVSEAAKAIAARERPSAAGALIEVPSSQSMPSGHALTTLVLLGLLVWVAWRAGRGPGREGGAAGGRIGRSGSRMWVACAAAATAIFAGLIGVSRVYLGVHWLSDVIGGWCLGGAWLAAYVGVLLPVARRRAPGALASFLAARPPARTAVCATAVVFAVVICMLALVFTAFGDPLLRSA